MLLCGKIAAAVCWVKECFFFGFKAAFDDQNQFYAFTKSYCFVMNQAYLAAFESHLEALVANSLATPSLLLQSQANSQY